MSGFKEPSFADRQKAAQEARKNILNKFLSRPGPNDPMVKVSIGAQYCRPNDRLLQYRSTDPTFVMVGTGGPWLTPSLL